MTCPHDAPPPGERPCRHSLPKGACDRPDEFLCVEWLKGNGPRASVGANDPTANVVAGDVDTDAASTTTGGFSHRWRSLFDHAPPGLAPPRRLARARPTALVSTAPPPLAPPPALLASAEDVATLASCYAETQLETDELGPVWLVAEPTGSERLELTDCDAAVLATVCAAFPGARVLALERTKKNRRNRPPPVSPSQGLAGFAWCEPRGRDGPCCHAPPSFGPASGPTW